MLLAASSVAAQAEDRKCIREAYLTFGDMKVAKRLCDPNNFVTNPKEYGWYRLAPECKPELLKGEGAKLLKDAVCE